MMTFFYLGIFRGRIFLSGNFEERNFSRRGIIRRNVHSSGDQIFGGKPVRGEFFRLSFTIYITITDDGAAQASEPVSFC